MAKPFYAHTNLGIAMVKNGWSVSDLAFETRINPRYIGYYLKGEKQMSPDHLRKIAQVLHLDPRDLFQPLDELASLVPHQDHTEARRSARKLRPYERSVS
jgi:transcriptional regulator with XRE-family HTH domain